MTVFLWLANPSLSRDQAIGLLGGGPVDDMIDTIHADVDRIPADFPKVAGYITGTPDIRWTDADWNRFHGQKIRINQSPDGPSQDGDVFDIEPGAQSIQAAVEGCRLRAQRGWDSTCYVTGSELQPCIDQLHAAGLRVGPIVAVQWAWPSTNPGTLIPGTRTTLADANADLSVTVKDWFPLHTSPPPPPPPAPSGVAEFAGNIDIATGGWRIRGTAGTLTPGGPDRWWSAEIQLNERNGRWRVEALPFDSPPLGPRHQHQIHPKVAAAAIAGAAATAVQAIVVAAGAKLHLTPAEVGAITTAAATLAGYLKAS